MSTKAIKPKRDESSVLAGWESVKERAPSEVRADQPKVARFIAVVGLMLATVGAFALIFWLRGWSYLIGPGLGFFLLALGLGGLLLHAFNEKDLQYRRLYGAFGAVLLIAAVLAALVPIGEQVGVLFLPVGVPFLILALLFLTSFSRNETDAYLQAMTVRLLGIAGALMIAVGILGSNVGTDFELFLLTRGVVLLLLGLMYVGAFVALQGYGSDVGYRAGLALGAAGAVLILIGVLRPMMGTGFSLVPSGLLLIYLGLEYVLLAIGICSDHRLVVLTRRELAAFFYSPMAYIILIGLTVVGWFQFWIFVGQVAAASEGSPFGGGDTLWEPIVQYYILSIFPVISVIFAVPVLTMRLFSEERRTGTLEVLLTAPVKEWPVVLSKFLAALRFFLLAFYPWGLFLIALRVEGGEEFDYRPLLSFFIALAATGAAFLAMGVFFSSITKNQVAAAILTFMAIMVLTGLYWLKARLAPEGAWNNALTYASYIDLWIQAVRGSLAPRYLLFYISAAVFWLFMTKKVLEARKWS